MATTDRTAFLKVKERLDHYRLSAPFPIDALPLLLQLLNRLDAATLSAPNPNKNPNDSTLEHSRHYDELQQAMDAEMRRLLQENNELRRNLLLTREDNEALKQAELLRWQGSSPVQRGAEGRSLKRLLAGQQRRERELGAELEQARYKYNELMELIHEDPLFERKYLRRLLKHKKLGCDQLPLHDAHERLSEIEEIHANRGSRKNSHETKAEVAALQTHLRSRELEILRLQTLVEEGSSYVALKRWRQQEAERREALLAAEIEKLGKEKAEMERELEIYRLSSSGKEVLARKMEKMKTELQIAVSKEEALRRSCQEQQFDLYIKDKELKRRSEGLRSPSLDSNSLPNTNSNTNPQPPQDHYNSEKKTQQVTNWAGETRKPGKKTIRDVVSDEKARPKRSTSVNKEHKVQSKGKPPINRIPIRTTPFTSASSPQSDPALLKLAYQRLLAQKNAYIKQLQDSLKSVEDEKGQSAQNINSGNTQTNNLVIKHHKNEYITFNNKSPEEEKLRKKMDRTHESLLTTERDRDKLAQKVRELEAELARERDNAQREREEKETARESIRQKELEWAQERQKSREAEQRESRTALAEGERVKQLEKANERLRIKLQQTQNNLIQTNSDNLSLQKELNDLLRSNPTQGNAPNTQENQQMKKVENLNLEECWLELIFLRREIKRLSTEVSILRYERDILQGKLKETEKVLSWQGTEMGHFERRVTDETESPLPNPSR